MLPVRAILPRETLSPPEGSDGTSPTKDMDDRASGKREKFPISAAMEKAVAAGIPLTRLGAETAGAMSSPAARSSMAPPGLARLSPGDSRSRGIPRRRAARRGPRLRACRAIPCGPSAMRSFRDTRSPS